MQIGGKLGEYYHKYKSFPVGARAAFWFVVCTVLQRCISFITVPIFTRIMPAEEYGLYGTYLSVYSIATVICTLSMEKCVYINGIAKASSDQEKDSIPIPLLSLSEVITVVLFLVYLVFRNPINGFVKLPTALMCLVFVQVLFEPPVVFWSTKQRYEYKYIQLVLFTIGLVVANSILGIVFVLLSSSNQSLARVFSVVLVQVIFGGICYFYFFKRAKCIFKTESWSRALKIQLPLLPHSLSLIILSSSDRIMINSIVGSTQAAIYTVAYSAGYVVTTFKNAISSAMTPWFYDNIKKKNYRNIYDSTKPVMLFVALLSFVFVSFAPEIVFILAPEEYQEAIYVIPPVAASSFFMFLYNMFSNVSFFFEKTGKIMIASVIGAVLNIVLNAVCIPIFGYIAAGYTTLVCYIVFTIAHYCIMKQISNHQLDGAVIFDMKFIIVLSVFVLIVTILFSFVYSSMLIRYILLLVLLCFAYQKRKMFIDAIKTVRKKG